MATDPVAAKTPAEEPGVVPGMPAELGHTERTASPDRSADCGEPPVGSERGSQPSPTGVTVVRTDAREAEGSGLLSRPASDGRAGSNPAPSACPACRTESPVAERGSVGLVPGTAAPEGSKAANAAYVERLEAALREIGTPEHLPEHFDALDWWRFKACKRGEIARDALGVTAEELILGAQR